MIVFFNGTFIDKAQATVSVDDRGFLFGDGVYEVFRATEGELFAADRHLRRLARGLAVLELARPAALTDAALLAAARRVLDDNALTRGDALVYLQITRGAAGPRAHQFPPAGTPPTVYLAANAFTPPDDVRARGASAVTTKDLPNAEEVFVTSTSADVMPVVRVDGRPVGGGQPGPVAQRLHTALRALRTRPAPAAALRSP